MQSSKPTKKDWEVIGITKQGRKFKKIITLGRLSDAYDVNQALLRSFGDVNNIREITSIRELRTYAEGGETDTNKNLVAGYIDLSKQKPQVINDSVPTKLPVIDIVKTSEVEFTKEAISNSTDLVDLMKKIYGDTLNTYESFYAILLNQRNQPIYIYDHSKGGIAGTTVDPNLVLAVANKVLARGIVIFHNHPSGNLTPSQSDRNITQKIGQACNLLDITLLDHIILTKDSYYSFADSGERLYSKGGNISNVFFKFRKEENKFSKNYYIIIKTYDRVQFEVFGRWYISSHYLTFDSLPDAQKKFNLLINQEEYDGKPIKIIELIENKSGKLINIHINEDEDEDDYAKGGGVDNIKVLEGHWYSYNKGIWSGKKDEGYITIKNENDLANYIKDKLGNVVKSIKLLEKGKRYPYNRSNPYSHDIYLVTLKNGTEFNLQRQYGVPNWSGNVDYTEAITIENIKYAKGGGVGSDIFPFEHNGIRYNVIDTNGMINDRGQRLYKIDIDGYGSYNERAANIEIAKRNAIIDIDKIIEENNTYSKGGGTSYNLIKIPLNEIEDVDFNSLKYIFETNDAAFFIDQDEEYVIMDLAMLFGNDLETASEIIGKYNVKKYARGGGVGEEKWQIQDSKGNFFSQSMSGKPNWYESPDMGYIYSLDEAKSVIDVLNKMGYSDLKAIKYKKQYANGGGVGKLKFGDRVQILEGIDKGKYGIVQFNKGQRWYIDIEGETREANIVGRKNYFAPIYKKYLKKIGDKAIEYAKGGRTTSRKKTTFESKVKSIKRILLERKKVPKAVQKDYGKTFSPAEAEDSAKRIVGAMRKKEMAKKK
jgi:DNA repair protein RadC